MFQRPKRALLISTGERGNKNGCNYEFQRPKRALLISTTSSITRLITLVSMFQRPKRALLISTEKHYEIVCEERVVSTP